MARLQSTHRSLLVIHFWCPASNRQFHLRAFSIPFNSFVSDTEEVHDLQELDRLIFQFIRFWYHWLRPHITWTRPLSIHSFLILLQIPASFQVCSQPFNSFVSDTEHQKPLRNDIHLHLSIHSFLIQRCLSILLTNFYKTFNSFVSDTLLDLAQLKLKSVAFQFIRFWYAGRDSARGRQRRSLSIHSFLILCARAVLMLLPGFQFIRFWYLNWNKDWTKGHWPFNSFVSDTLNLAGYTWTLEPFNSFVSDTNTHEYHYVYFYVSAFNSFVSDTRIITGTQAGKSFSLSIHSFLIRNLILAHYMFTDEDSFNSFVSDTAGARCASATRAASPFNSFVSDTSLYTMPYLIIQHLHFQFIRFWYNPVLG